VRFKEAALKAGFVPEKIWIMKIGETAVLKEFDNDIMGNKSVSN